MSADYLKLFRGGRLNPNDPIQKKIIDSHLGFLQVEDPKEFEVLTALYDSKIITEVVEKPKAKKASKKSSPSK